MHNIFKKSLVMNGIAAALMLLTGELLAKPLSSLFVGNSPELMALTLRAFRIFSLSFPFASMPIYGSSFFTALNDGKTSALISFLRTMLFQIAAVELLPLLLKVDGIWISIVAAEVFAACLTCFFFATKRKKFGY